MDKLPVELLYEIQLYALSPSLPRLNQRLAQVFAATGTVFRGDYILQRALDKPDPRENCFTRVLRYSICTLPVLDAITRHPLCPPPTDATGCELPKRLFRGLTPKTEWVDTSEPLPFLTYIYESELVPNPYPSSHDGYSLTRAVHAGFVPLIQFLLDHGASPGAKKGLPVLVAIRQKDLALVKILIERNQPAGQRSQKKRRKLADRIESTSDMLRVAVKSAAWDIVDYLTKEKDVVADMQTLQMMMR